MRSIAPVVRSALLMSERRGGARVEGGREGIWTRVDILWCGGRAWWVGCGDRRAVELWVSFDTL